MSREASHSPWTESMNSHVAVWRDRPAATVASCELRGFTKVLRLRKGKAILRDLLPEEQANVQHQPDFLFSLVNRFCTRDYEPGNFQSA